MKFKTRYPKARLINAYNRANLWLNVPTKLAMIAVYFKMYKFEWYYWLILPIFIGWMIYDIKVLYPEQMDYGQTRSKTFNELVNDVKEIKQLLILILSISIPVLPNVFSISSNSWNHLRNHLMIL